jgi:hypothetical protein
MFKRMSSGTPRQESVPLPTIDQIVHNETAEATFGAG